MDANFGITSLTDVWQASKMVDMAMGDENMAQMAECDLLTSQLTNFRHALLDLLVRITKSRAGVNQHVIISIDHNVNISNQLRKFMEWDLVNIGFTGSLVSIHLFDEQTVQQKVSKQVGDLIGRARPIAAVPGHRPIHHTQNGSSGEGGIDIRKHPFILTLND